MTGVFISFEGGEGAGKSTQIKRLHDRLTAQGHTVLITREPGGTPGAEAVRKVILSGAAKHWGVAAEAVLFAAARADNVSSIIKPALKRGEIVLSDRFFDSSRVYQGVSGGVPDHILEPMQQVAIDGAVPDLTFILDIDPETGLERAAKVWADEGPDRFESDELVEQQERRAGFLAIAEREPDRCIVVDASQDVDQIENTIWAAVSKRLANRHQSSNAA